MGAGEGSGDGKGEMENQQVIGMQPVGYGGGYAGQPMGYAAGQQTVIVTQQPAQERQPSMTGAIVFSCFVFWCCSPLFGCIAFFVAIGGLSAHSPDKGRQLRSASYGMSIAGLVITVLIIIIGVIIFFVARDRWNDLFNSYYNDVNDYYNTNN